MADHSLELAEFINAGLSSGKLVLEPDYNGDGKVIGWSIVPAPIRFHRSPLFQYTKSIGDAPKVIGQPQIRDHWNKDCTAEIVAKFMRSYPNDRRWSR